MHRSDAPPNRSARPDRTDRLERIRRAARPVQQDRAREPIYVGLVAEWRAQGRTVPAEPDVPRAAFPGPATGRRATPERG
ncbi:hypothetical protein AQI95_32150 [Streptomyces yokosukanensis]|uniref:Uncharacterized protein n=2 Tax=Streptomyces yokosukanensis TaxID=67386 RepID=A0A117Q033_9ACTN|nr:hypothetical protein AQI95_32150 [Streptomyces yokosukanensis]